MISIDQIFTRGKHTYILKNSSILLSPFHSYQNKVNPVKCILMQIYVTPLPKHNNKTFPIFLLSHMYLYQSLVMARLSYLLLKTKKIIFIIFLILSYTYMTQIYENSHVDVNRIVYVRKFYYLGTSYFMCVCMRFFHV